MAAIINAADIPVITRKQMLAIDTFVVEKYGIHLLQMMENAGSNLADLARIRFLNADIKRKNIIILAGTGGNGGGALVCARHLHNRGGKIQIILAKSVENFREAPLQQIRILKKTGLECALKDNLNEVEQCDLVIDGLIGYSLSGNPRGTYAEIIKWVNEHDYPVLSLDVPSGVDVDTGKVFDPAIRADATMTLALPKTGLISGEARDHIGELFLADIGIPPEAYFKTDLGKNINKLVDLFSRCRICRVKV